MATTNDEFTPAAATYRERLCGVESVFDAAPIGLCVLDLNFRYMTVNACFARMYGLGKDAFINRTVTEALPGPASQILAHLQHALDSDQIVDREIVLQNPSNQIGHADSQEVTYLRTAQPIRDERGVVYGISVALLDITQRKKAIAALRESEENLHYTVELTPHIPWTADASGELTFMSPRWNTITGRREGAVHLKEWAEMLHPEDLGPTAGIWLHSVQSGKPYDAEYRISFTEGGWKWVRARAYPRHNESGQIVRWYGTVEDIHDRKIIAIQLAEATQELARRAQEDHLTGLPNRRRFDDVLEKEINRARRSKKALAVILVDVDRFKQFNDIAGHLVGDECLRMVAKAIDEVIQRPADLAARFGGEEFAIILPETDHKGALEIATRAVDAVRGLVFPHADIRLQQITISAGVAAHFEGDYASTQTCMMELLQVADAALYQAKANGRNCVISRDVA